MIQPIDDQLLRALDHYMQPTRLITSVDHYLIEIKKFFTPQQRRLGPSPADNILLQASKWEEN